MLKDNGLSIKDLLTRGITEEDLIADLQAQIADAKEEIKQEKNKKAADLAKVRHEASTALRNYFIALGILDEDEMDDKAWEEAFKETEQSLMSLVRMKKIFKDIMEDRENTCDCDGSCSTQDVETVPYSKADKTLSDWLKTL